MFQASLETCSGEASMKPLMLPPLEKCSPTARRTMMRTCGFSSIASNTRRSWSRCGISMILNGGRSRITSARSRSASISTRNPSSRASRGSAKVIAVLIVYPLLVIDRKIRLGPIFAGHELAAQKLTDRRFGNFRDEDVTPRTLEVGEAGAAAERVELLFRDGGAPADEGTNDFAPALMRQPDHGNLGHRGMQRQTAFDLHRRDVLATGDDHVVDPAGDEQIAIGIDQSGVPGEIPATAKGDC